MRKSSLLAWGRSPLCVPGSGSRPYPVHLRQPQARSKPTAVSALPGGAVTGAVALPDGTGYIDTDATGDTTVFGIAVGRVTGGNWLVASDRGVFDFNTPFYGSPEPLQPTWWARLPQAIPVSRDPSRSRLG